MGVMAGKCFKCNGSGYYLVKTDPAKLDKAKESRQAKKDAEREAREAAIQAKLDDQRERNGGLTDAEMEAKQKEDAKAEALKALEPMQDDIDLVIQTLNTASRYTGDFCFDVSVKYQFQQSISARAREIVAEILAKKHGKKNSKAYNEALPGYQAKLEEINQAFCKISY
jgi:hypothetical protein